VLLIEIPFLLDPSDKRTEKIYYTLKYLMLESFLDNIELSKEDLKLIRNMIYAQHGYVFKDMKLQDFFSKFKWYIADPNLTLEQIKFSEIEKKFLNEILEKEKEEK